MFPKDLELLGEIVRACRRTTRRYRSRRRLGASQNLSISASLAATNTADLSSRRKHRRIRSTHVERGRPGASATPTQRLLYSRRRRMLADRAQPIRPAAAWCSDRLQRIRGTSRAPSPSRIVASTAFPSAVPPVPASRRSRSRSSASTELVDVEHVHARGDALCTSR